MGGSHQAGYGFRAAVKANGAAVIGAAAPGKILGWNSVLLQGVIDCLLETDAGFTILDFKTDRVTPGTMTARAAGYAAQLDAYAAAVARMFGRPVTARVLYFFAAQAAVRL